MKHFTGIALALVGFWSFFLRTERAMAIELEEGRLSVGPSAELLQYHLEAAQGGITKIVWSGVALAVAYGLCVITHRVRSW